MTLLLPGKLVVTCPRLHKEVDARQECVNCQFFRHVAYRALTPYVACTYQPEEPKREKTEKKGLEGLKRW